jgi:hypothetical protein
MPFGAVSWVLGSGSPGAVFAEWELINVMAARIEHQRGQ